MADTVLDSLIVRLGFKSDKRGVQSFENLLKNVERGMERAGRAAQRLGTFLTGAATGALTTFAKRQSSWTAVSAQTGLAIVDLRRDYEDAVKALTTETGLSEPYILQGLQKIISGGVQGAEAIELLGQGAKAEAASMAILEDAVSSATTASVAYGLDASRALNITAQAAQLGEGAVADYSQAVKGLVGLGSALGLEYDDVNAALAATAQVAKSVRIAETQIRSFFQSFTSPTEDAKKALEDATNGLLTFQDIRDSLDTQGIGPTFKFLKDLIGDDIELKTRLVPRIEGQLFFDTVNPDDLQNILSQIDPQGAAVDIAFEAGSEDIERRTDIIKQEFLNRLADIGERLIPVFDRFEQTLGRLLARFDALTDEQKDMVAGALAAGPAVLGVGVALRVLAPLVGLIGAALGAVSVGALVVVGAVALIAAAIGGLVFAFWKPISTFVKGFVDRFRDNFGILMDGIKGLGDAFQDAWSLIKPPLQPILDFFQRLRSAEGAGEGGGVATGVLWVLRVLIEGLAFAVRVLGVGFRILFELIAFQVKAVIWVVKALIATFRALWNPNKEALNDVRVVFWAFVNAIRTAFWALINGLKAGFGAFVNAMTATFNAVMAPIHAVVDAVQWLINKIKEAIGLIKNLNPGEVGKRVLSGVGNVITDNPLVNSVKGALTGVRNLLPFSDAKEGPLSDITASGRALIETFARGIESATPLGSAVSGQLLGATPATTVGGTTQTVEIIVERIEVGGDNATEVAEGLGDALTQQIRNGFAQFSTPFVA